MNDIRARIAALVAGKPTKSVGDAFDLADTLIRELGWRQEQLDGDLMDDLEREGIGCDVGINVQRGVTISRWVTDWIADE